MPQTGLKREFLERASRERPEYRDLLGVFLAIYAYVDGREGETGISFGPPDAPDDRTRAGFPVLSPESVRVDAEPAASFLLGIVDVLAGIGREGAEELARLRASVAAGSLDLRSVYAACLARDRGPLDEAARSIAVPPALLEFALEVPLRTALERFAEGIPADAFPGWKEGFCPVCGGRPGMDEICGEEGKRRLSCSGCFHVWPFKRLKCPYCGCEDPEALSYFTSDEGPTRVSVCRRCSRYIKTRDSRKGRADVPLETEDLVTLHLDLLAAREGFERGK